jgi:hypothetical protein
VWGEALLELAFAMQPGPLSAALWESNQCLANFELNDASGNAVRPAVGADVTATVFGTQTLLVACPIVTVGGSSTGVFYLAGYDIATKPTNGGLWNAAWHYEFDSQGLIEAGVPAPATSNLRMESFTQSQPSLTPDPAPLFFLAFFMYDPKSGDVTYWYVPLAGTGEAQWSTSSVPSWSMTTHAPIDVRRDPAGRLRMYYATPGSKTGITVATFDTSQPVQLVPDPEYPPPLPNTITTYETASPTNGAVSAAFYVVDPPSTKPVTLADGSAGTAQYSSVYEFVFYNGRFQVLPFGHVQYIVDYATQGLIPAATNVVLGIFEAPAPIPNINIPPGTYPDVTLAQFIYGATTTKQQTHQSTFAWSVGTKSSGDCTQGVGAAWDISLSYGQANITSDSEMTSLTNQVVVDSVTNTASPPVITPAGTIWCGSPRIHFNVYEVYDNAGDLITDSPQFVEIWSDTADPNNYDVMFYPPGWANVPGDLDYYTPDGLNARMQALGYSGDNYFAEVVVPNGYLFSERLKNYLQYSAGGVGFSDQAFNALTAEFTEQAWTVDDSVYVGLSGGGSLLFLENQSWKVMVGYTIDKNVNTQTLNTEQWGLSLPTYNPPLGDGQDPAGVANYSWRAYFLPVPSEGGPLPQNYWTLELVNYLKNSATEQSTVNMIDPNSASWKILFVVMEYQLNDGTSYSYTGQGS